MSLGAASVAPSVAVIGAGPAGLMAAQTLAEAGHRVDVFDAMPSVGRKFLLAGVGGLNLTHAEAFEQFVPRYAQRAQTLLPALQAFGPQAVRDWCASLGISTFVGSSQRVFPTDMKAAPLLRAWLQRLRSQGVRFHMRQRWLGWAGDGALRFVSPHGEQTPNTPRPLATVLALGGASWQRLGSDGAWWPWLQAQGVELAPLQPSNCGFEVAWSEHLKTRHAGAPLKGVALEFEGWRQLGECVLTATGIEGSLIYAASSRLRNHLLAKGPANANANANAQARARAQAPAVQGTPSAQGGTTFTLDLLPQRSAQWVSAELAHPRGTRSLATHLKSRLSLHGAKAALIWECVPKAIQNQPAAFAAAIKAVPITVTATRPLDEAISTAGGVRFEALDHHLMLRKLPGVFCAGEMLDWEAPTGGYLLTACLATGRAAGQGAVAWLSAA